MSQSFLSFETVSVLESYAEEVIEVSSYTVISVIAAVYIVPYMRHTILFKAGVVVFGIVINGLIVAAGSYHQEVGLIITAPSE